MTGQTKRVLTAIWSCKTQPMPEAEVEEEEEEEEEWDEEESDPLPQTRVGKVHRPPPFHPLFCFQILPFADVDFGLVCAVVWTHAAHGRLSGEAQATDLDLRG